ncbi:efflux RND transporter periplasmic adaptor subunit [Roseiconus nitratireducens]|nr:efflux RND transporter periplasmic adaptor subunit [Roseiconus nitratireducens]
MALVAAMIVASGCTPNQPVVEKSTSTGKVPVRTVAVMQTEVRRTTTQPATVHAFYRAEMRAKASGYVKQIFVDIGDVVQAGAKLAEIDVPELNKERLVIESRIGRLKAEEERAQANLDLAQAGVRSAEAKREEAKSGLKRAEAALAAADAEYERTDDLVQRQSLQPRVLDEVRKRRDSQRANRDSVASSIDSAEAEVAVAQARRAAAEADLRVAQAETQIAQRQLEQADVLLDYAIVKAPFDGVITDRRVEPGELVRESSEVGTGAPLFVVSQTNRVRIHIPVPEGDAALVNRGDKVSLTFPSFASESPVEGTVTRLSGSLDPSTRTMLVEVEVDNADGKLIPGMFGQATIELSTQVAANTLPSRAVRFGEDGQAYVYVVGDDQKVSVATVQTGNDDGAQIEILSGVRAGQHVIDAHLKRFVDGEQVAVLAANSPPSPTRPGDLPDSI